MMNPRRAMTLAYTPYFPGFAHPSPQDTIPVCRNSPVLASTASRGPPLSPCECNLPLYLSAVGLGAAKVFVL